MKRFLLLALALLVAVGAAYLVFKGRAYTVHIERAEIQSALDARLPYSKNFLIVFTLTVNDVDVILADGADRIGVTCNMNVRIPGEGGNISVPGTVTADAGIRYEPDEYCFYLVDPVIRDAAIQGIPPHLAKQVSGVATLAVRHLANTVPIYRIKDKNLKSKLARAILKEVRIVNGRLEVKLGY